MAKVTRIPSRERNRLKNIRLAREQYEASVSDNEDSLCKDISVVVRDFELRSYRDLFRWFQRSWRSEEGL